VTTRMRALMRVSYRGVTYEPGETFDVHAEDAPILALHKHAEVIEGSPPKLLRAKLYKPRLKPDR